MVFHGHITSSKGVEFNIWKTEAVKIFPRPSTPKNIRSFFGIAGYYRRFVHGFVSITSPLTTLTCEI